MSRRSFGFVGFTAAIFAVGIVSGCGDGGGAPDAGLGVTISQIANQTIDEDGTTGSVAFTATSGATLTGSSSNKTLVPDASIVFGGSGSSRTVTITPAENQTGMTTITVTARSGSAMASTSFMLTVRPINDLPTISNITDKTSEEGTALPAITFTVGDAETAVGSLQVTATSNNTALVPASGLVLGGSGANRTLTVTPAATGVGTATITVKVSDGTADAMDTFVVTVNRSNAVNDPPSNTVPGAQSVPENTPVIFSSARGNAISVTDADAGNASIRVTLQVSGGIGTLALSTTSGLTFSSGGNNQASMTFTGTIANINAALNGLTLTPPAEFNGTGGLTITTNDLGNTGSGGMLEDSDTVQVDIERVNAPPEIEEVDDITIAEDGNTGSLAVVISDSDTPIDELTVTRESSNPDVVAQAGVVLGGTGENRTVRVTPVADAFGSSVITITVSDGDTATTMSFTVTVTAVEDNPTISDIPNQSINAGEMRVIDFTVGDAETAADDLMVTVAQSGTPALTIVAGGDDADRTLTITAPAGQNGNVTVTVTVTDGAGRTKNDSFVLAVNNVNDPPVVSVPGAQVVHTDGGNSGTGTLTFTSARPITVSDDDVGTADLSLRLQATEGFTTVGALPAGVSRTDGADESADQTLEGPIDAINEVLDGLLFTSDPGFSGDASLEVTVNDLGHSGTGGAQSDSATIDIHVNVKPTISELTNKTINEDATTGPIPFTILDFEQNTSGLTVTALSSNHQLVPADGVHLVLGGSGGSRTIEVEPLPDQSGQTTITVKVTDADGGERRDLFIVTVTPVNDAPVLDSPGDSTTTEDVDLVFNGTLAVDDIDSEEVTVTLEATDGTITLASTIGLDLDSGDGTDDTTVVFTGSLVDVNLALDGARFQPDPDFNGEALLSVEVDDGDETDDDLFAIEVVASNDAPVIATDDGLDTLNTNSTRTIHLSVSDLDVTPVQEVEVTFVVSNGATLEIPSRTGLDFTTGTGTGGETTVRFRGTLADINDSLDGAGVELTPTAAFTGDVTLTGTVSDLGNTGEDGVKVTTASWVTTYANANTAPTVSAVEPRTIDEDAEGGNTATFTIGDAQTGAGNLEVSVSSTGNVLVELTLGGSGANRTVTAVPAADDNGTATITIHVTDGKLTTNETYELTVRPINDRPEIAPDPINVAALDEDGFVDVSFDATDADGTTPTMQISSDNTTLLPNSAFTNLTTGGVRITPVAQQSGSATVTLTASDGLLEVETTFVVVVRAVNDAPVISGSYPSLSVDDEEVDDGTYQVTIDADGGTVTLATVADLTFVDGDDEDELPDGDGNQESHMIFRGDRAAVNDALDGLIDSVDDGTIVITVSDLGVSPPTEAEPELTDTLCVEVGDGLCD